MNALLAAVAVVLAMSGPTTTVGPYTGQKCADLKVAATNVDSIYHRGRLQAGAFATMASLSMNFPLTALIFVSVTVAPRNAKGVARAFERHYQRATSMAGLFLEKYTSGGSGIVVESGKVYFEKPGKMRWDYDSPEKKMFLVDGKNVWYYVPADHTASRTSVKKSTDWRTPLALLAGKAKLERLCGSLTLANGAPGQHSQKDPEESPSAPGNSVLVCKPRKADADMFSKVLLEVNSKHQLVRLSIRQPGDIELEFRFGDWHEDVPIAAAKFQFEPPPGVAIVDDAALAGKVQ